MQARPRPALAVLVGALATTGLAFTGLVNAGPLADPTRPPSSSMGGAATGPAPQRSTSANPSANPSANLAAAQAVARAVAAAEPAPALPLLQSVQVPLRGPAVAMVDGRLVKAGDTVDGRVVVSIDNQGLVLTGRLGNQRLWLLGGSPKQAPGSIETHRTASIVPAVRAGDAADADAADAARPAQRADRGANNGPQAATPGPLSVAGKTQP